MKSELTRGLSILIFCFLSSCDNGGELGDFPRNERRLVTADNGRQVEEAALPTASEDQDEPTEDGSSDDILNPEDIEVETGDSEMEEVVELSLVEQGAMLNQDFFCINCHANAQKFEGMDAAMIVQARFAGASSHGIFDSWPDEAQSLALLEYFKSLLEAP